MGVLKQRINGAWVEIPVVSDHGQLTGLGDDDHAQYLLTNGGRQLTGAWTAGNDIIGVTLLTVDNVSINTNTISTSTGNLFLDPADQAEIVDHDFYCSDSILEPFDYSTFWVDASKRFCAFGATDSYTITRQLEMYIASAINEDAIFRISTESAVKVAAFELLANRSGAFQSFWQFAAFPKSILNGGLIMLEAGTVRAAIYPNGSLTLGISVGQGSFAFEVIDDATRVGQGAFQSGLIVNNNGNSATTADFRAESSVDANAIWLDTVNNTLHLRAETVFNENAADYDWRMETQGDANAVFLDASANALGIGLSAPLAKMHVRQNTAGSTLRIFDTAAASTGSRPTEYFYQSDVTTTDATITLLEAIVPPTNSVVTLEISVVARQTGGSAGTTGHGAGYKIFATYRNIGGTITQIGATTATATHEDNAAWAATLTIVTSTVRLRVTGEANKNISWHSHVLVREVTT